MIKAVIFDVDGVLADTRGLHAQALNTALGVVNPKYKITPDEDMAIYDGLPSRGKLKLLTQLKGLPAHLHDAIMHEKEQISMLMLRATVVPNPALKSVIRLLKLEDLKVAVVSNSGRHNVRYILKKLDILQYVDYYYGNSDFRNPKPHGEPYMRAMIDLQVSAKETIVVEDSLVGQRAAFNAGTFVLPVTCPADITEERIWAMIHNLHENRETEMPWQGAGINVIIPMAGEGSRFKAVGFKESKPFIPVRNELMIGRVLKSLHIQPENMVFIIRRQDETDIVERYLKTISPVDPIMIPLMEKNEGAACTVLEAGEYINPDHAIVIINSDNYLEWDSREFFYAMQVSGADGGIATFESDDPKFSFAKVGGDGWVTEVAEKKVISNLATAGVYYWKRFGDFQKYAAQMMKKDIRVNNEFYVCPVYNEAIADGKKIKTFPVKKMWSLGTPEDLQHYLDNN